MDCAFGANVGPTRETVVTYLLLTMLLAVVNNLLAWTGHRDSWRMLGLFASGGGTNGLTFCSRRSGWQFYHRVCQSSQLKHCWGVQKGLFSTNLADIELSINSQILLYFGVWGGFVQHTHWRRNWCMDRARSWASAFDRLVCCRENSFRLPRSYYKSIKYITNLYDINFTLDRLAS